MKFHPSRWQVYGFSEISPEKSVTLDEFFRCEPELFRTGCYQLFLQVKNNITVQVGALGNLAFSPGMVVYTGRHQRSLPGRIRRHAGQKAKNYWHIDYLTSSPDFSLENIILYPRTAEECILHQSFQAWSHSLYLHSRFGNGDCTGGCDSHLLYLNHSRKTLMSLFGKWMRKTADRKPVLLSRKGNSDLIFNKELEYDVLFY
ncbi:MAG: DUF123 domain-containing protein [Calditrichaeota bacterium]|nr:MAG: DUF123 domain-containing protein [Calditrichota bacterium]